MAWAGLVTTHHVRNAPGEERERVMRWNSRYLTPGPAGLTCLNKSQAPGATNTHRPAETFRATETIASQPIYMQ